MRNECCVIVRRTRTQLTGCLIFRACKLRANANSSSASRSDSFCAHALFAAGYLARTGSPRKQPDMDVTFSKILPTQKAKFCAAQQKPHIAWGFCNLSGARAASHTPLPVATAHASGYGYAAAAGSPLVFVTLPRAAVSASKPKSAIERSVVSRVSRQTFTMPGSAPSRCACAIIMSRIITHLS